jgi:hypothetical protein
MRRNHLELVPSGISGNTGEIVNHPKTVHPDKAECADKPPSTPAIEIDPAKLGQDALHGYN